MSISHYFIENLHYSYFCLTMKRVITFIFFLSLTLLLSAKEVKLLTIGNSFSESLYSNFEKVCASVDDCKLVWGRAHIPGCSLKQHCMTISAVDENPKAKPYDKWHNSGHTLKEILNKEKWDIVSIQQASHDSWRPETYQPFGRELYKYIKEYVPNAEVVIQQTWSYRKDDPRLTDCNPSGNWKIDQFSMYKRARACYHSLANIIDARIIPMGDAVWLYRYKTKFKEFIPTIPKDLKKYKKPELPSNKGDVVGAFRWGKDKKTGADKLIADYIHLNRDGEYLQACVWFGFIFEKSPLEIKYKPNYMSEDDAKFYRQIAAEALKAKDLPIWVKASKLKLEY